MKPRGFTLIELLVVIAIIGLLASIVLASLTSARTKAKDASRVATLTNIQLALEEYYSDHNAYPSNTGWTSQCSGWGGVAANSVIPGLVPSYMSSMPADPDMVTSSNVDCLIYYSNGTDYKLLDYNLVGSTLSPYKSLIDPNRNIGTAWQNPSSCPSAAEGTWALAVWSAGGTCW